MTRQFFLSVSLILVVTLMLTSSLAIASPGTPGEDGEDVSTHLAGTGEVTVPDSGIFTGGNAGDGGDAFGDGGEPGGNGGTGGYADGFAESTGPVSELTRAILRVLGGIGGNGGAGSIGWKANPSPDGVIGGEGCGGGDGGSGGNGGRTIGKAIAGDPVVPILGLEGQIQMFLGREGVNNNGGNGGRGGNGGCGGPGGAGTATIAAADGGTGGLGGAGGSGGNGGSVDVNRSVAYAGGNDTTPPPHDPITAVATAELIAFGGNGGLGAVGGVGGRGGFGGDAFEGSSMAGGLGGTGGTGGDGGQGGSGSTVRFLDGGINTDALSDGIVDIMNKAETTVEACAGNGSLGGVGGTGGQGGFGGKNDWSDSYAPAGDGGRGGLGGSGGAGGNIMPDGELHPWFGSVLGGAMATGEFFGNAIVDMNLVAGNGGNGAPGGNGGTGGIGGGYEDLDGNGLGDAFGHGGDGGDGGCGGRGGDGGFVEAAAASLAGGGSPLMDGTTDTWVKARGGNAGNGGNGGIGGAAGTGGDGGGISGIQGYGGFGGDGGNGGMATARSLASSNPGPAIVRAKAEGGHGGHGGAGGAGILFGKGGDGGHGGEAYAIGIGGGSRKDLIQVGTIDDPILAIGGNGGDGGSGRVGGDGGYGGLATAELGCNVEPGGGVSGSKDVYLKAWGGDGGTGGTSSGDGGNGGDAQMSLDAPDGIGNTPVFNLNGNFMGGRGGDAGGAQKGAGGRGGCGGDALVVNDFLTTQIVAGGNIAVDIMLKGGDGGDGDIGGNGGVAGDPANLPLLTVVSNAGTANVSMICQGGNGGDGPSAAGKGGAAGGVVMVMTPAGGPEAVGRAFRGLGGIGPEGTLRTTVEPIIAKAYADGLLDAWAEAEAGSPVADLAQAALGERSRAEATACSQSSTSCVSVARSFAGVDDSITYASGEMTVGRIDLAAISGEALLGGRCRGVVFSENALLQSGSSSLNLDSMLGSTGSVMAPTESRTDVFLNNMTTFEPFDVVSVQEGAAFVSELLPLDQHVTNALTAELIAEGLSPNSVEHMLLTDYGSSYAPDADGEVSNILEWTLSLDMTVLAGDLFVAFPDGFIVNGGGFDSFDILVQIPGSEILYQDAFNDVDDVPPALGDLVLWNSVELAGAFDVCIQMEFTHLIPLEGFGGTFMVGVVPEPSTILFVACFACAILRKR